MPTPGTIFIFGGCNAGPSSPEFQNIETMQISTLTSGSVSKGNLLTAGRAAFGLIASPINAVYIIGGLSGSADTASIDIFNPAQATTSCLVGTALASSHVSCSPAVTPAGCLLTGGVYATASSSTQELSFSSNTLAGISKGSLVNARNHFGNGALSI